MHYSDILDFHTPDILQKRIALLKAIDKTGSISKAAKSIPMSYKAAWEIVDSLNNLSKEPLLTKEIGGSGGGGTKLTSYAKRLIDDYEVLKNEYERFLSSLSNISDISAIKKLALRISARNQLFGKIVEIRQDKVSADISFELKSGIVLRSNITLDALKDLELKIDDEIVGIIKASSILISNKKDFKRSVNIFEGIIEDMETGRVNTGIKIDVNQVDKIWLTCKNSLVKELSLKENQKAYIFIRPKDILIGK
jgi:molybdate transport system regulatory protein